MLSARCAALATCSCRQRDKTFELTLPVSSPACFASTPIQHMRSVCCAREATRWPNRMQGRTDRANSSDLGFTPFSIADLQHDPVGKLAALCQHSSGLDQLQRQVDAVDPATIRMREIPRRPADATANIENAAVLCNCNPVSLTASGGQTPRMKMLEGSKDFRAQILRVMSQFSQRGVDPRKHARSRPMRLNVLGPFSHGVLSCSSDEA